MNNAYDIKESLFDSYWNSNLQKYLDVLYEEYGILKLSIFLRLQFWKRFYPNIKFFDTFNSLSMLKSELHLILMEYTWLDENIINK